MNPFYVDRKIVIRLLFMLTIVVLAIVIWNVLSDRFAGGIVYEIGNDQSISYLLVETKKGDRWILPKGKVKFLEFKEQAAVREVAEEAGVHAIIKYKLESSPITYRKSSGKIQEFDVYAMEYQEEAQFWREKNKRSRKWMSFNESRVVLSSELFVALKEVHNRLNNNYHTNKRNRE